MLFAVLSGFVFALFFAVLGKKYFGKIINFTPLLPLSLFVYFTSFLFTNRINEKIDYKWVNSLDINLTFNIDYLGILFSMIITGIGTLVYFYATYYMKNHEKILRFYAFLSIFMGAMLGLVLSDNIITLFIFWELTSISSFFLIGFNNEDIKSRKSAMTALSITGLGGMALLAFGVVAGMNLDTYSIQEMLNQKELFAGDWVANFMLIMLILAALTKSAQFPFHYWLPGAMKAPTPVSTYLHSATMVKAGIYLLIRFSPHFVENIYWTPILLTFGGITMFYAAYHTLFRKDLKGILAYSTITALGILVFLIGLQSPEALTAAIVFIIVHALYKAALFLITGIVDHQTGTRDITKISGLGKLMIPVAIAGIISAVSSAGIPPSIGFIGKDLIYEASLHTSINPGFLTTLAVLTNILMVFAGFAVGVKPFIGKLPSNLKGVKKPNPKMWIPPVLLSILSLLFGIFPGIIAPLVNGITHNISGEVLKIKLWHGFNFVFLLSLVTIIVGLIIFYFWKQSNKKVSFIQKFDKIAPSNIIDQFVLYFKLISLVFTKTIQNGYLRKYVSNMMFVFTLIMAYHIFTSPFNFIHLSDLKTIGWNDISVVSIMFLAILFTVFSKSRLAAIAGLGVVGYAMCFIFVFYSAPDLAMTQFTIDTLTVILFVLVLYRLPKYLKLSNTRMRYRDGVIALSLGTMITLMVLEVMNETKDTAISEYYAENAYLLAKGKNIVNVILVDFRGFDTMVEVIVLSIAALGVFGLLKLHLKRNEK